MSFKQLFLNKLKEIKNKPYKPKFNIGDIILNKKFKVVRKVIQIHNEALVDMESLGELNNAQYKLMDLANPHRELKNIQTNPVWKYCIKIDSYYEKIDERTAKILYGVKHE